MIRGESFARTAMRHCGESGIAIGTSRLVGVYPVRFPSRHDVTTCMAAKWKSGEPLPTAELSRYRWFSIGEFQETRRIGTNYRRMLRDWRMSLYR